MRTENRTLLLLSKESSDLEFCKALCQSLDGNLFHIEDPDPFLARLKSDDFNMALFSIESAAAVDWNMLRVDAKDSNRLGLLSSRIRLNEARPILSLGSVGHLLIRPETREKECISAAAAHFARIARLNSAPSVIGLNGLGFSHSNVNSFSFESSMQKSFATSAITAEMISQGINERIAAIAANAADELLMNAIYDAPQDGQGEQIFKNVSRSQIIPAEGVKLQVAIEPDYIGFSIVDRIGRIDRGRLFNYATKGSASEHPSSLDDKTRAGAGIGLAMILRSGGSLLFHVETGVKTEVSLIFKRTHRITEFRNQFQYFSTHVL